MRGTLRRLLCTLLVGLFLSICSTPAYAGLLPLPDKNVHLNENNATPRLQNEVNTNVIRDPATLSLLMDEAGLLTNSEASVLREMLNEISDRYQADVVIVTVNTIGATSPMEFADDFFDYNGYGRGENHDGILLLISMQERDWWISTTGRAISVFTDAGIEFIGKRMISAGLSSGDYAAAFTEFASLTDRFFQKAAKGAPFDSGHMPKTKMDLLVWVIVGLVGGFIIALIVTGGMKKKLKSVAMKQQALDYILPSSFLLSSFSDELLGKSVAKTPIPAASSSSSGGGGSSTHTGSSGISHGGGGGKF